MSLKRRSFNRGSIACIYSAWLLVVKYDGTAQVQPQKNHSLGEKSKASFGAGLLRVMASIRLGLH